MNIRSRYLINNMMFGLIPIFFIIALFFFLNRQQAQSNMQNTLQNYVSAFKDDLANRINQLQDYAFFISRISRTDVFRANGINDLDFPVSIESYDIRLFELFKQDQMIYRDTYAWRDSKYFTSDESAANIWKELSGSQYSIYYKMSFPEIVSNILVVRSCSIVADDNGNKIGYASVTTPLDYEYLSKFPVVSDNLIYFIQAGNYFVFSNPNLDDPRFQQKMLNVDYDDRLGYGMINFENLGDYICYKQTLYSKPLRLSNRIEQQVIAEIGVLYNYGVFFNQYYLLQKVSLIVIIGSLIAVFMFSYFSARKVTNPILQLKHEVENYERDMRPVTKPANVSDEILSLRQSVSEMTEKILFKTIEREVDRQSLRERNQTLTKELDLARTIQMKFIPQESPLETIAYVYKPMERVGGDFFDFIQLPDGRIGIFISDVSGHGVSAAFVTSIIKSFSSQALTLFYDPALYLYELNDFLCQFSTDFFVTAIYGVYDPAKNVFNYSNAGHNFIIGIEKDGKARYLEGKRCAPLAIFTNKILTEHKLIFENETADLNEFAKALFYTDGLTEAANRELCRIYPNTAIPDFEKDELFKALKKYCKLSPKKFLAGIMSNLVDFRGEDNFDDDICMICLETPNKKSK